jgi:hypothetical protein
VHIGYTPKSIESISQSTLCLQYAKPERSAFIMAKAQKLPSGSWRYLVYDYTDSQGKKHYKSFTADTKK